MERIGFIGLGTMGKPMARHLLNAGFPLTVYNRSFAPAEELAQLGAYVAINPAETATKSDIIITMLPDTKDVVDVALGTNGIIQGIRPGSLVIDMSTICPEATVNLFERFNKVGSGFLDAPVTGGQLGAENASLCIMVGGRESDLARALPCFNKLGKKIVYMGDAGNGQKAKLCNQVICGLNILAVCEGLTLAKAAGLDCGKILDAISNGAAGSWMLSNLTPKILTEDWNPGFKIKLQEKDLRLAVEMAEKFDLILQGTDLTHHLFKLAESMGFGELGTQALIKVIGSIHTNLKKN